MAAGIGVSAPAAAGDFGCEVVLCLSNPGGSTEYAACIPPIAGLYRALALGKGVPPCPEADVGRTEIVEKRSAFRGTVMGSDGSHRTSSQDEITPAPNDDADAPQPGTALQP
jgi:hypothetical protein